MNPLGTVDPESFRRGLDASPLIVLIGVTHLAEQYAVAIARVRELERQAVDQQLLLRRQRALIDEAIGRVITMSQMMDAAEKGDRSDPVQLAESERATTELLQRLKGQPT